ncbi:MAG: helix-turn-helix domain-containing protein [Clostridia bacterium]|nr:helix-turn-helix domain-containing protein [Clostridia bacterium]
MDILSNFSETLGELIFDYNNGQQMHAKDFAKLVGVNATTITRYLAKKRLPTIESLVILADFFKCSTDYLLGLETENYSKIFKPCPNFAERFKDILKENGLTCIQLSELTNINQSLVYAWKNGKRMPSLENAIKIAKFFDYSLYNLLGI